jgi:hypothetical protein
MTRRPVDFGPRVIEVKVYTIEGAWQGNEAVQSEVSTLAGRFILAERLYGRPGTLVELEKAKNLIPKPSI